MLKIINISESFFFEDWNISGYFRMLKGRFWYLRGVFLREYGAAGDWFFWGLIILLAVIFCIYVKLLADMLKKSEAVIEEEIDEEEHEDEIEEEYEYEIEEEHEDEEDVLNDVEEQEAYAENEQQEVENEVLKQSSEDVGIEQLSKDVTLEQPVEYVEQNPQSENLEDEIDKEQEEMEKKLSVDIVQTSKTSDDYLNLRKVLYKQSKDNNEGENKVEAAPQKAKEEPRMIMQDKVWDLDQTVGVIVNMIAHRVSDKKIAQSVYYLNKGADDPEEIIQLIKAVKNFVGYCNTAKFDQLPNRQTLSSCEDALYALARGDNKACMELMEALLNTQVALAQRQKGLSKELSYALAADYACTMGTIANLNNYELAINSFELALDLAPKNVNALSRTADLYWQDNNAAKAAEVYQQVLSLADDVIYPEQKANANLKLSQYYRTSGKMFKADEMEKDGRKFFENYGIRNPLSEAEKKSLQVLLDEHNEKLTEYIKKLL